jgi:hypothetical protein
LNEQRYWIGVASANHLAGGFMQVNHGKLPPLKRISPGDVMTYFSPVATYGGTDKPMAFTANGIVADCAPYQGEMGEGYTAFRRDGLWRDGEHAPIHPLLPLLDFTREKQNWGCKFRFGLYDFLRSDMTVIANAMGSELKALGLG